MDINDTLLSFENVDYLCSTWGDFSLEVLTPLFTSFKKPRRLEPEIFPDSEEVEFVYPIYDYGNRWATFRGEDVFRSGMSMCKLHATVEKMVRLFLERLKEEEGGESGAGQSEMEIEVAFSGAESPKRKAFESLLNLPYNIVVNNFTPGAWAERLLNSLRVMAETGYGYPESTPRSVLRESKPGIAVTPSSMKP